MWKKLEVGDIVLLRKNEQVPADVVVLATSGLGGMSYQVKATTSITTEEDID